MSATGTVNSTIFPRREGDEFLPLEESVSSSSVQLETPTEEEAPLNSTFQRKCSTASQLLDDTPLGYAELQIPEENPADSSEQWDMNYHEASIYLEEGDNNDKFIFHPRSRDALPAYTLVHNRIFYCIDLFTAVALLSLAFTEKPAVPGFALPEWIHASIELMCLSLMCAELAMKVRWMGRQAFLHHKRSVIKTVVLIIMILEAIVVLGRQSSHFRVTRALRPVFLIDNHYCKGIRRVIRQIMQSLPPILDMMSLLLFFMLIFSVLGFYLFHTVQDDTYFTSLEASFVSLFVLLTTANYPDVMMPSYAVSKWSSLFFITFIIIHVYFLMNLMLAVVYETFTRIEKDKFRKLLLHRRKACQQAFRLLVTRNSPLQMSFRHFHGLMKYFQPKNTKLDNYLMFKTLDMKKTGYLTMNEFLNVFEASPLRWKPKRPDDLWFIHLHGIPLKFFAGINKVINHQSTEFIVNTVIAINGIWQVMEASEMFGHATADIIVKEIEEVLSKHGLSIKKLIMISSDGPKVNKKVLKLMDEVMIENRGQGLVNIGTCNLHIANNSFQKGLEEYGEAACDLIVDLYNFFKKFPSRWEDFEAIQAKKDVPSHTLLKHSSTRWLTAEEKKKAELLKRQNIEKQELLLKEQAMKADLEEKKKSIKDLEVKALATSKDKKEVGKSALSLFKEANERLKQGIKDNDLNSVRVAQECDSNSCDAAENVYGWVSIAFVSFYTVEVSLKIVAFGLYEYFRLRWNRFDFGVTLLAICGLIAEQFRFPFSYVTILRSLRLLRLFKLKKRYRDVLGTLFIILPRFLSVALVLVILYYFFGIIGMEIMSGYDLVNCCQNTTVEQFYRFDNDSSLDGYYYLNNFDNFLTSQITLFELMVVNNWFIIMNGYANVVSEWTRLFFMSFYIVTMIVINIIVAFVLEAFLFRIQYKRVSGDMDKESLVRVDVGLNEQEVSFCRSSTYLSKSQMQTFANDTTSPQVVFRGTRTRTKFSFSLKMYGEEVKKWLKAAEDEERLQREMLLNQLQQEQLTQNQMSEEDILTFHERTFTV
ncbi:hypothetical protein JTE90_008693 [Oedothorax gibbosus]|uniref:EF-hand domain-containing protein n=1 Tax=Oedothorax gibbosus TaxID=931172 RepID=A0AAV6V100_9ARAC|nr:hypothetical protein JTE90_008693 [Oedothorax gibbosus]